MKKTFFQPYPEMRIEKIVDEIKTATNTALGISLLGQLKKPILKDQRAVGGTKRHLARDEKSFQSQQMEGKIRKRLRG